MTIAGETACFSLLCRGCKTKANKQGTTARDSELKECAACNVEKGRKCFTKVLLDEKKRTPSCLLICIECATREKMCWPGCVESMLRCVNASAIHSVTKMIVNSQHVAPAWVMQNSLLWVSDRPLRRSTVYERSRNKGWGDSPTFWAQPKSAKQSLRTIPVPMFDIFDRIS